MIFSWFRSGVVALGALFLSGGPVQAAELPTALQANTLRAQILPRQYTTMSSELPARLEKLPLEEGARFKNGDLLASLDCSLQRAQLEKARAALTAADKLREVNSKLLQLKSVGELEVVTSGAEAAKARAEVAVMTATVAKCAISAPFSGRIVEWKARPHQFVQAGQALLELLDDSILEVEFIAPSRWLQQIKPGSPFTLHVDETGQAHAAKIIRIGAKVDAVSQSIKISGQFLQAVPGLLAGMSGRVVMDLPAAAP
ncbi:MAG: efflux RND transporter periplasmic adaptor subunit [Magnetococcales bacterium]|nr:efflux RND transporter periplasmic adaptor subunit [Magnetococcales bacterium]MBF0113408.1 efflux RND transporter periplasmic adaptor subunit [Magnetococcales bacterium]